jgi:DNA end-binding protein Ku
MAYSYKGAITFGLVYIPITLSLSIKEQDIGFNMLEKKTKSRVKYKKTCVDCNDKEIKTEDIVKGYQYEKDKYFNWTKRITFDSWTEKYTEIRKIDYLEKEYWYEDLKDADTKRVIREN